MSPRNEAIQRLSKTSGSWGWKGPKRGELHAGMYEDMYEKAMKRVNDELDFGPMEKWTPDQDAIWEDTMSEVRRDLVDTPFADQFSKSRHQSIRDRADDDTENLIYDFRRLQEADVPREWTGKIVAALGDNASFGITAKPISNAMRNMTDRQRELYLQVIPGVIRKERNLFSEYPDTRKGNTLAGQPTRNGNTWSEQLSMAVSDTGAVISDLEAMTPDQLSTFFNLLPTWKMSIDRLVKTAKTLYRR